MEGFAAIDAGDVVTAEKAGVVLEVSADVVTVQLDEGGTQDYFLRKFDRSNQGTCYNQRVVVSAGERIEAGEVIADGPATENGELALGKNLLVAFMTWEGHNFEDAIILSQDLVKDDTLSSIHIEEYEVDARDTKLGKEEITRDLPNVSPDLLKDLDERGIIRIGAEVRPGDILVGKVTPKGETELSAEERLLRAIFNEKSREVRDTSLKVPHGEQGTIIAVKEFNAEDGDDELGSGVNRRVVVYIAQKRKITEGDKLAGRHGNKGVIAKILPVEDMPFLADGTPVDVILNPLGIPGRMNFGQVLETHLGWIAKQGWKVEGTPEWAAAPAAGGPRGRPRHEGRHPGVRRRVRGGDRGSARLDEPHPRRRPPDRLERKDPAVRRPLRRAVPGTGLGRLHVHPEAAPPRRRQDPRTLDGPVLDDHPAAARW